MSYARLNDAEAWWHYPASGLTEAAEKRAFFHWRKNANRFTAAERVMTVEVTANPAEGTRIFKMRVEAEVHMTATIILDAADQEAIKVTKDTAKESAEEARRAFEERVVAELKFIRRAIGMRTPPSQLEQASEPPIDFTEK